MALVLEQINVEGLAHLSYLVGDDKAGQVAVIDPRRDVSVYVEKARELGVRITHIIETHIHADFVSGAHELKKLTGAPIHGGKSKDYAFDLEQMSEDDEIEVGSVTLRALHTPGHTPEHVSFLVFDKQQGDEPFGVFTGDTLFNLDVGRPDLLGGGSEKEISGAALPFAVRQIAAAGRPRRNLSFAWRRFLVRQKHRRPATKHHRQRAHFQQGV